MKYSSVVESLTNYIKTHPEIKLKQTYEIYNLWVMTSGIIIKDISVVQWIMDYIDDMKSIAQKILDDTSSKK